jgi:hypothetical protein
MTSWKWSSCVRTVCIRSKGGGPLPTHRVHQEQGWAAADAQAADARAAAQHDVAALRAFAPCLCVVVRRLLGSATGSHGTDSASATSRFASEVTPALPLMFFAGPTVGIERVFEAWYSEEVLTRWLHANPHWDKPVAEGGCRVGGTVRIVMPGRALRVAEDGYPDGVRGCGPGASNGGTITFPPRSTALVAVASASSTAKVTLQCAGVSSWSSAIGLMLATTSSNPFGAPSSAIRLRMSGW